jgi:hypothetical protein
MDQRRLHVPLDQTRVLSNPIANVGICLLVCALAPAHVPRGPQFAITSRKVLVNFITPLMWVVTISYFVFRTSIGDSIEAVYPPPVFYVAVVTLLLGHLLFIYTFLLGSAHRNNHDPVKYRLLARLLLAVDVCCRR